MSYKEIGVITGVALTTFYLGLFIGALITDDKEMRDGLKEMAFSAAEGTAGIVEAFAME